jgi:outer membrane protein assembly factor BamB
MNLAQTRALSPTSALLALFALAPLPAPTAENPDASPRIIASPEAGWPQFRGPRRDGISDERGLLPEWPEGGPKKLWSVENLGRGFSSPTIVGDSIYITGDVGEELHLFALDLEGRPLWQARNGASWRDPYPGARSTLTFSEGRLYSQNAHGRVACFDAATGREQWAVDLLGSFDAKNITWGLSEGLLVDEEFVYATAGGAKALLVALDKKTGAVRWQSPPLQDSQGEKAIERASYVSPVLVQIHGRRLLVGCSLQHLFIADARTGAIEWTHRFPTRHFVISMMPVFVGDSVFMTAPHGQGGRLFRLLPPATPGGPARAEERWRTQLDTLQGCVVHIDGKLIGSFYSGRKGWAALDPANGEVLYTLDDTTKGAPIAADGRIYALCEDGWMLLLEAGPQAFTIKGRFRLAEAQRDAWAHPVIHQGRLYLRYHDTLSCFDIRAGK